MAVTRRFGTVEDNLGVARRRRGRDPGMALGGGASRARWDLPSTATSVGVARSGVRQFLRSMALHGDLAALVVSELVTNAVVHAGEDRHTIGLTVHTGGGALRIEVADHDPRPPVRATPGGQAAAGRGLMIVDRVATRWGWTPLQPVGKVVWCELPAEAAPGDDGAGRDRSLGGDSNP